MFSNNRNSPAILPFFSRVKQDELFSSWIIRNAHRHKTKVHTFTSLLFPNTSFWNRDIDKTVSKEIIQKFSEITKSRISWARKSSLKSYEGKLFENLNTNGHSQWVLSAGIYHRTRKLLYLQYCPKCLGSGEPYYRTYWRLALFVCCPFCGTVLKDNCPRCKHPVIPFRVELGKKWETNFLGINFCYNCSTDLCIQESVKADISVQRFTKIVYRNLHYFERRKNSTWENLQYFNGLDYMIAFLSSSRKKTNLPLILELSQDSEIVKALEKNRKQLRFFGMMTTLQRYRIIFVLLKLLKKWPTNFIKIVRDNKIKFSSINVRGNQHDVIPYWIYKVIKENTYMLHSNPKYKKRKYKNN